MAQPARTKKQRELTEAPIQSAGVSSAQEVLIELFCDQLAAIWVEQVLEEQGKEERLNGK